MVAFTYFTCESSEPRPVLRGSVVQRQKSVARPVYQLPYESRHVWEQQIREEELVRGKLPKV